MIFGVVNLIFIYVERTRCGVANMTDESKTKTVRNAMLGVVVVVLLGLVGCLERSANMDDKQDPSDVIDIVVAKEPLAIPEQLRKQLEGLDAESVGLIDGKNQLILFSVDGVPRDLCAPSKSSDDYGPRTCKQEIPSKDLMIRLSGAVVTALSGAKGDTIAESLTISGLAHHKSTTTILTVLVTPNVA
jgi:hypothetical protein